jgi:Fur family ferric uptake transcriptional regulator
MELSGRKQRSRTDGSQASQRAEAASDDQLREDLSTVGLRVTTSRLVVLRELAQLRVPTSHPELADRLCERGLDRTTVYRNLLVLTRAGLLVRTQLADRVSRFELPRSKSLHHDTHPHFVCSECGSVACLPANSVALRGEAKRNEVAEVQLRGRCARCALPTLEDDQASLVASTSPPAPADRSRRS